MYTPTHWNTHQILSSTSFNSNLETDERLTKIKYCIQEFKFHVCFIFRSLLFSLYNNDLKTF